MRARVELRRVCLVLDSSANRCVLPWLAGAACRDATWALEGVELQPCQHFELNTCCAAGGGGISLLLRSGIPMDAYWDSELNFHAAIPRAWKPARLRNPHPTWGSPISGTVNTSWVDRRNGLRANVSRSIQRRQLGRVLVLAPCSYR